MRQFSKPRFTARRPLKGRKASLLRSSSRLLPAAALSLSPNRALLRSDSCCSAARSVHCCAPSVRSSLPCRALCWERAAAGSSEQLELTEVSGALQQLCAELFGACERAAAGSSRELLRSSEASLSALQRRVAPSGETTTKNWSRSNAESSFGPAACSC